MSLVFLFCYCTTAPVGFITRTSSIWFLVKRRGRRTRWLLKQPNWFSLLSHTKPVRARMGRTRKKGGKRKRGENKKILFFFTHTGSLRVILHGRKRGGRDKKHPKLLGKKMKRGPLEKKDSSLKRGEEENFSSECMCWPRPSSTPLRRSGRNGQIIRQKMHGEPTRTFQALPTFP